MSVEKISNHIDQATDRLIEQYKCSPNLKGVVELYAKELQEIEDAAQSVLAGRNIFSAEGSLLDEIGSIVGQPRNGNIDEFYRILILVRIGQNTSNGEPEKIIDIFKLITQASKVQYQEHYPAGVGLMSDGTVTVDTVEFLYSIIQSVLAAGVRLDSMGVWDPECNFAFAGDTLTSQGFGDLNDGNVGGCLSELYVIDVPFAFEGDDENALGFGDLNDPVIGGTFQSV